jgi:hypothetical protein
MLLYQLKRIVEIFKLEIVTIILIARISLVTSVILLVLCWKVIEVKFANLGVITALFCICVIPLKNYLN